MDASTFFLQAAPVDWTLQAFLLQHQPNPFSTRSQSLFLEELVKHPMAESMPLRPSYVLTVAKRYMQLVEEHYCTNRQVSSHQAAEEGEEGHEVHEDLVEWYAEYMSMTKHETLNSNRDEQNRAFRHFRLLLSPTTDQQQQQQASTSESSKVCPWAHVCVTSQFTNVGLSLWPSAMITVTRLLEELTGRVADPIFLPRTLDTENDGFMRSGLRLVELGAGVGLTAIALEKLQHAAGGSHTYFDKCVMTDYQPNIVDNLRSNLLRNRMCNCQPNGNTQEECEEGGMTEVSLLDWDEHDRDVGKWKAWAPNVILAADCIYDVCVLEGLAQTIVSGLTIATQQQEEERLRRQQQDNKEDPMRKQRCQPVAIVIQTLRQRATIRQFFLQIQPYVDIECYHAEAAAGTGGEVSFEKLEMDSDGMPIVMLSNKQPEGLCSAAPLTKAGESSLPTTSTPSCLPEQQWNPLAVKQLGNFVVEMAELICVFRITLKSK